MLTPLLIKRVALLIALASLVALSGAGPEPRIQVVPEVVAPGGVARVVLRLPSLARTHAAYLHYGFNGWNVPLAGPGAGSDEELGNINYFKHVSLREEGDGSFTADIEVPIAARALHFAVCWNQCGSGDWDNNGGRDYSWPIAFPYIGPYLAWAPGVAPDTGMTVTFFTSIDEPAWIRFGREDQTQELRDEGGERHSFTLTDLAPDTAYWYEVGAGGHTSPRYELRTARPAGALSRLSFGVFGDAQDNGETGVFGRTTAEIVAHHDDLDFLIVTGDMPWNDHAADWWAYFDKGRALFARKVVMPAIGNHDTPGVTSNPDHSSYRRFFDVPAAAAGGASYEFGFGPARFFALDSERLVDFSVPDGAQLRWLNERFAARRAEIAASDAPLWTFTFRHIPSFNAGRRHWAQQFDFRAPTRAFAGVVDWDFSGHEHLAQRFQPLRTGGDGSARTMRAYGRGDDDGVGYLLVPPAGAHPEVGLLPASGSNGAIRRLLAFPADPGFAEASSFNGFARVDIDGSVIQLRTFGAARSGDEATRGYFVRDEVRYSRQVGGSHPIVSP